MPFKVPQQQILYAKQYRIKNKQKRQFQLRLWRKNNPDKKQAIDIRYREKNRKEVKLRQHLHYIENKDQYRTTQSFWKKNNLDKIKKIYEKYLKKHNLNSRTLLQWAFLIKQRDFNHCQICNKLGNFAHHIFYKSKYPQLALNLNNGITLCQEHHREAHGWH